jgi:hypothetical protein
MVLLVYLRSMQLTSSCEYPIEHKIFDVKF